MGVFWEEWCLQLSPSSKVFVLREVQRYTEMKQCRSNSRKTEAAREGCLTLENSCFPAHLRDPVRRDGEQAWEPAEALGLSPALPEAACFLSIQQKHLSCQAVLPTDPKRPRPRPTSLSHFRGGTSCF
jgi:hypothetical protein